MRNHPLNARICPGLQSKKNQSIKETEYSNEKDDVGGIVAHSVENVTSEGSNEVEVIKSPAETDEPKDTEEKSVLGKKKRCAEQQLEEGVGTAPNISRSYLL